MIQRRFSTVSSLVKHRLDLFESLRPVNPVCRNADNLLATENTLLHSSAHLLGWALEKQFGNDCLLTNGPATDSGFYYDMLLFNSQRWIEDRSSKIHDLEYIMRLNVIENDINKLLSGYYGKPYFLRQNDLSNLQKLMMKLASGGHKFEQMVVSKAEAARIFAYSPFKLHYISQIAEDAPISVFKSGNFVDLCTGPHIKHTGIIKGVKLLGTSASFWPLSEEQSLCRVNGISFDSTMKMKEYTEFRENAEKRNHRIIGQTQQLFMFSDFSPGSPFLLPHGVRIIDKILDYLKIMYKEFGFESVITPLIFDKSLWEQSGHWDNYKDDMFSISGRKEGEEVESGLKPMNCPGHCLIYKHKARSYRDLPMRLSECSPVHRFFILIRNESTGALTGLFRVRKFHQDDGHIFCRQDQIKDEIKSTLEFINQVYNVFGFHEIDFAISTRPEKYIGSIKVWDDAETALVDALKESRKKYYVKEGDGAFYGPKIDIMVKDALRRSHQTATIQLDFQLPERFRLNYQCADGSKATPVIIHRAALGSIERFLGILIEHYGGKWPFWLSPRQILIVTTRTDAAINQYSVKVRDVLGNFHVDIDDSDRSLSKKVFDANSIGYTHVIVLGDSELLHQTVTIRNTNRKNITIDLDKAIEYFDSIDKSKQ